MGRSVAASVLSHCVRRGVTVLARPPDPGLAPQKCRAIDLTFLAQPFESGSPLAQQLFQDSAKVAHPLRNSCYTIAKKWLSLSNVAYPGAIGVCS